MLWMRIYRAGDFRAAVALAVFAAITGMVYSATWGGTAHFFQELFGPAVLYAAGHGFQNPDLAQLPALDAFLHPAMSFTDPPDPDAFDVSALPDTPPMIPWESFQQRQRYLIFTAGILWAIFGVAWSSLTPFYGIFYGVSALAWYGIMRLGMGRSLACVMTLLLTLSPLQLNNLLRLRDFSKAPFLLLAILLIGWLLLRGWSPKRLLGVGLALGLLIGVGVGFRMDVLVAIPAFLLVCWLFTADQPWHHAGWKAGASVLCVAAFLLVSWPITRALETGMKYQDFFLGMSEIYDERLGVGGAPYQLVHRYLDREPMAILHAATLDGTVAPESGYEFDTIAYEATGQNLFRHVMLTFPADQLLRAWAAVLRTLDEMHPTLSSPAPRGVESAFTHGIFSTATDANHLLTRYTRYTTLAVLLLISMVNPRLAFGAAFILIWFTGYGAIQFASRHTFAMEFIGFWSAGTLLSLSFARLAPLRQSEVRRAHWRALWDRPLWRQFAVRRAAAFVAVCVTLILIPLWTLRLYQDHAARRFFQPYAAAADAAVIESLDEARPDGQVLIRPVLGDAITWFQGDTATPRHASFYLTALFDTRNGAVPVSMLYAGNPGDAALTWAVELPQSTDSPTLLHFPVYFAHWKNSDGGWTGFEGLLLPSAQADTLLELRQRTSPVPAPYTLVLTPDWEEQTFYQRLVR